jgi:hypothetical protein
MILLAEPAAGRWFVLAQSHAEWLRFNCIDSRLGGAMVSVLAIIHKVPGFKHGLGDGFLSAKKIRSTPSFGGEVKPEDLCRNILRM